jgi:protein phosphatase
MDKLAIISDVHGNLPALEAVLNDIKQRNIDIVYCLGDLVGKGPSTLQTVTVVRKYCKVVLKGNWDEKVTCDSENEAILWHQKQLSEELLSYLKSLPFHYDFYMSGKLIRLLHASSKNLHQRVFPDDPVEKRLEMFDISDSIHDPICHDQSPQIVGYGDIHRPFLQNIRGKLLFNTGSVCNPNEMSNASYTIMEGTLNNRNLSSFSIQFVSVPYDIELAIMQAKAAQMPFSEKYVRMIKPIENKGMVI